MKLNTLLQAVGSTEETTFGELCLALGDDKPEDKSEWRELFVLIEDAEKQGFVEVERTNGKLDWLQLTEAGANKIRDDLDKERPLFN